MIRGRKREKERGRERGREKGGSRMKKDIHRHTHTRPTEAKHNLVQQIINGF